MLFRFLKKDVAYARVVCVMDYSNFFFFFLSLVVTRRSTSGMYTESMKTEKFTLSIE